MKTMLIRMIFFISFLTLLVLILNMKTITKSEDYILMINNQIPTIKNDKKDKRKEENKALETFYGTITAYGPDCEGCIGITASGLDVSNNIYYKDKDYGSIRIIAADIKYPFGTIIKLSNINNHDDIIAIVLDRGSAIGNNKKSQIDLLFESESLSYNFGRIHNVKIEVLRLGY